MDESTKRRARFLIDTAYVAVIIMIVYIALKYVAGWVLPFLLAFCIVSAIHPIIMRIVRSLGIKREVASIIVMVLVYAFVGSLLFLILIQIIFTVRDSLMLLPDYYSTSIEPALSSLSRDFGLFIEALPEQWQQQYVNVQADIILEIQRFLVGVPQLGVSALSNITGRVPTFMLTLVFTIMLSFFISLQYDAVVGFIKTQMPQRARVIMRDARLIIIDTVFKYLRAALTLMAITFCELSLGLLVLGQKKAVAIAAGIAIFDAMPFFGTGAIVVPWALIEFLQGNYTFAMGLIILYAIVAFLRSILEPKIVGDKLGLNPVVTLTSIYLGYKLFGVLGMILMPITTQIVLSLHKKGRIRLFRESVNSGGGAQTPKRHGADQ